MHRIDIVIQSKEDAAKGPAFPEIGERATKIYELSLQKVSILEGGMASGKCSVSLIAEAEDGAAISLLLGAEAMDAIASALHGAQERFDGREPKKCNGDCNGCGK